jgi:hypothetical protein
MFIVCGVLYAVDHVDVRDTKIRFQKKNIDLIPLGQMS